MKRMENGNYLLSYLILRRIIGILGMLLPFLCVFFGYTFDSLRIQRSISFYYHTNVRDLFVGLMIAVSLFLITYKGYDLLDDCVSTFSGVFGIGLALFPCKVSDCDVDPVGLFQVDPLKSDKLHAVFAALFFLLLALNSIFLFTKSNRRTHKTKQKIIRNRIYRICGCSMIGMMIILLIVMNTVHEEIRNRYCIVLIVEAGMLIAFGISWLVKGETILKDKKQRGA